MQDLTDRAKSVKAQFVRELKTTVNFIKYMFEMKHRKDVRQAKLDFLEQHDGGDGERKLYEQGVLKDYGRIELDGDERNFDKLIHPDLVI